MAASVWLGPLVGTRQSMFCDIRPSADRAGLFSSSQDVIVCPDRDVRSWVPALRAGETLSEGGFAPNKVAAASVLDVQEATDKKGKKYYKVGGVQGKGPHSRACFCTTSVRSWPGGKRILPLH